MTAAPDVVTIFVTVSVPEPPTVAADAFSKRMVSPEPGAAAGAAPLTSQLPGTAQSAPSAPAHT